MITMIAIPTIPIPPMPAASMCLPSRGAEHIHAAVAANLVAVLPSLPLWWRCSGRCSRTIDAERAGRWDKPPGASA
jgi:hypothetical protein